MSSPNSEGLLLVAQGAWRGARRGGLIGAVLSVATGAAVVVTAPAWLPWVGGCMAVNAGVAAAWATGGAVVGAATGAGKEAARQKRLNKLIPS